MYTFCLLCVHILIECVHIMEKNVYTVREFRAKMSEAMEKLVAGEILTVGRNGSEIRIGRVDGIERAVIGMKGEDEREVMMRKMKANTDKVLGVQEKPVEVAQEEEVEKRECVVCNRVAVCYKHWEEGEENAVCEGCIRRRMPPSLVGKIVHKGNIYV